MYASELIDRLRSLVDANGDKPVYVNIESFHIPFASNNNYLVKGCDTASLNGGYVIGVNYRHYGDNKGVK